MYAFIILIFYFLSLFLRNCNIVQRRQLVTFFSGAAILLKKGAIIMIIITYLQLGKILQDILWDVFQQYETD